MGCEASQPWIGAAQIMISLTALKQMRVHFIGIGGAGMSGLARIMLDLGISVSGSDVKESQVLTGLQVLGAQVAIGHAPSNIDGVDLVVVSGAISNSNVEYEAAIAKAIPVIPRASALAILMSESISIAVAGTHGKTTTTSMLTVALQKAGFDPSFAIGGLINSSGTNAHLGTGEIFVAEADESDGSFLAYQPFGAIITNIELDHVDHFADFDSVLAIFHQFVKTIKSGGFLVLCNDDPGAARLASEITRTDIEVITYGAEANFSISRVHLSPMESTARITQNGRVLGELRLQVPGVHNVLNATAALAAGLTLGASPIDFISGLEIFSGTRRRFEFKGEARGVRVIDDYGHHPTEIAVTLDAARRYVEPGRLLVIFQPHRYSRTKAFAPEFAAALSKADHIYLLDIYAASETPIPGVTSELISQLLPQEQVSLESSLIEVIDHVIAQAKAADLIITLGAGDVSSLAPVILTALAEQ